MKSPLEAFDAHIEEVNQDRSRAVDARNAAERDLTKIDAELRGLMWARSALVGEGAMAPQPPAAKAPKAKPGACRADIMAFLGTIPPTKTIQDIEFGCPNWRPEQIRPVLRKMVAGGDIVLDEANGTYRLLVPAPAKARGDEALV